MQDFTHDNEMLGKLAALALYSSDMPLPFDGSVPDDREFRQSDMTPFGGMFVFERVSCPALDTKFVRIYVK